MSDHYYTGLPLSAGKLYKIENVLIRGEFYSFYKASGVFFSKKIDKGTLLLAEYMEVPKGRLLDLGCGIGVLGIVAAKTSVKPIVKLIFNFYFSMYSDCCGISFLYVCVGYMVFALLSFMPVLLFVIIKNLKTKQIFNILSRLRFN